MIIPIAIVHQDSSNRRVGDVLRWQQNEIVIGIGAFVVAIKLSKELYPVWLDLP